MLLHGFLVHVFRDFGAFHDFAVDLHHDLDFCLYGPSLVKLRPWHVGYAATPSSQAATKFSSAAVMNIINWLIAVLKRSWTVNRFVQRTFEFVRTLAIHDFRIQLTVVSDEQTPYAGNGAFLQRR